eukprot:TCONS_00027719-protein
MYGPSRGQKKQFIFVFFAVSTIILFELRFNQTYDSNTNTSITTPSYESTKSSFRKAGKRLIDKYDFHQLSSFMKQLARAQRYERNEHISTIMMDKIKELSRMGFVKLSSKNANKITIIFNGINEINDISHLLSNLKVFKNDATFRSTNILFGLSGAMSAIHRKEMKALKKIHSNVKWVDLSTLEPLASSLTKLLENVETKYVLLARNLRYFDESFDLKTFIKPLIEGDADVVSGSITYPDGQWSTGCFQSKLIWSQYILQFGRDLYHRRKWLVCDFIEGPFAMETKFLLGYFKNNPNTPEELLYLQLGFKLNIQNKNIKVHPGSIFHIGNSKNWLRSLKRDQWKEFIISNSISEIILTLDDNEIIHHEFGYYEGKSDCGWQKHDMLKPRSCLRYMHNELMEIYKLFDKLGYQYTNDDGSALAAIKLDDTLPWDLDQDFGFRTQNLTNLMLHKADFDKIGVRLQFDLDKPCMKDTSLSGNKFAYCGYVSFFIQNWRLECWGSYILMGDFYEPWKIPSGYEYRMKKRRIFGHYTKVRMRDHWSMSRPNPGYYTRGRYGLDVLKHVKHWMQGGAGGNFLSNYITAPHFKKCPETRPEHVHLCMDQYLADGNIQFQHPWA